MAHQPHRPQMSGHSTNARASTTVPRDPVPAAFFSDGSRDSLDPKKACRFKGRFTLDSS